MSYQPQEVDIPLYGMNQVLPDRSGPVGKIKRLVNAQVRKFVPGQQTIGVNTPTQISVDPRDGLVSLSSAGRSVVDGTPVSLTWGTPELLAKLGDQLVDIIGGVPRVWNGATWTNYPNNQVVTRTLSQDVFHTSTRELYVPDFAYRGGILCSVWTEATSSSSGPVTTSVVGFKGADGAWLVQPTALFTATSAATRTMAKVVSDGAHFFVFYNDAGNVNVVVYDGNGARLGSTAVPLTPFAPTPGIWDVTAAPSTGGNTVMLALPASISADAGVKFYAFGWDGVSVTSNSNTDASLHCSGYVAFLTNDQGNGLSYVATARKNTISTLDVWAYEVTNLAQTSEYSLGGTISLASQNLDSFSGYVDASLNVFLRIGLLPAAPASAGPLYDPALRYLVTAELARGGGSSIVRTDQSYAQVTRAFSIDGVYHSVGYYQSGSGTTVTPKAQAVTITPLSDYMTGAPTQPLTVQSSDSVSGSPVTLEGVQISGDAIWVSASVAPTSITAPSSVAPSTASGLATLGIPDGTPLLLWSMHDIPANSQNTGGRLVVTGSSIAAANSTWDVIYTTTIGGTYYLVTPNFDVNGNVLAPSGTFTAATGTVGLTSMTSFQVPTVSSFVTATTLPLFLGGSVAISGASNGGNNHTFTGIKRIYFGVGPSYTPDYPPLTGWSSIWVQTTSQVEQAAGGFTAILSPAVANQWTFANGEFDATYVGTDLVVSEDTAQPGNEGTFPITAVSSTTQLVTGGQTGLQAQVFAFPPPTVSIQLTTQTAYKFFFASLTLGYQYQGALVSVQGASNPNNNGVYQITQINSDGTFIATPTNGLANQVNELFSTQTVTIFFPQDIQPLFQPTWFLVPLTGTQAVTGRWEYGQAFADWRLEGDSTLGPSLFPMALSSPVAMLSGIGLALPFRSQNVTQAEPLVSAVGQVPFAEEVIGSTVGLKVFTLGNSGTGFEDTSSLLLPGPMAVDFTQSGFFEDGVNLAPEAPFVVSESVAGGTTLGLTVGGSYVLQAVWEVTDDNGNLIHSIASPPLKYTMSGTNNQVTYGGRLPFPLDTTGKPVANTYGPSSRNVTLSLYRTAIVGGIPTTQRYKITNDLSPNQIAPVSTVNPSGFSFPDAFTWQYLDSNPDIGLTDAEDIYTDGEVSHYPAPAFSRGIGNYKARDWVLGYDGSLWMSSEKVEGENVWYHPSWRWAFPTADKPLGLGYLEDNLFVFCSTRIWQIPLGGAQLPAANGVGSLPTPIPLPWPNGSVAGHVLSIPGLVVYDSTAGGVWAINRSLENVWLSHAMQDVLTSPVTGLAVDTAQKLYVAQGTTDVLVYDPIPATWSITVTPTAPSLIASWDGAFVYHDATGVNVSTPGALADVINGVTYGIAPDITLDSISFTSVRGQKIVWGMQAVGKYLGAHRVNFVVTYADDEYPDQVIAPFTPDPAGPWIIPFYLANEEVSSFGLRIYADFVGVDSPAGAFSLEMFAAEIGIEPTGLKKRPDSASAV